MKTPPSEPLPLKPAATTPKPPPAPRAMLPHDDLLAEEFDREPVAEDEDVDDIDDEDNEPEELDPEDIARRGEREGIDEDNEDDIM